MKVTFATGIAVFRDVAAERERKQRSKERCASLGVRSATDPALNDQFAAYATPTPAVQPAATSRRTINPQSAEFCKLLSQFVVEFLAEFGGACYGRQFVARRNSY